LFEYLDLTTSAPEHLLYDDAKRHRPANIVKDASVTTRLKDGRRYVAALSHDSAQCYRCQQWPTQAAEWPTHIRKHGCPDAATIQLAVNNGCDLVFTAHRQCKRNERYSQHMHRISFSRVETILLNSWTPKQQMAYHVIRYVIKMAAWFETNTDTTLKLTGQSESGIFSNYHLSPDDIDAMG